MIRVSEIFYSLEGEGPHAGTPTLFVRFFGCNLKCPGFGKSVESDVFIPVYESGKPKATGCDSQYSWHPWFKKHAREFADADSLCGAIQEEYYKAMWDREDTAYGNALNSLPTLSFTGGEPMLYQKHFPEIWSKLRSMFSMVLIETNGTQAILPQVAEYLKFEPVVFSVSPKLSNSGESRADSLNTSAVVSLMTAAEFSQLPSYFKFVVNGSIDVYREVDEFLDAYRVALDEVEAPSQRGCVIVIPPRSRLWPVYLMPEGAQPEQQQDLQTAVAEYCMRRGYRYTGRLHTHLWGNTPGR